jgi:hypothetical protein
MSDLVERLREQSNSMMFNDCLEACTMREAADALASLTAENAKLRAELAAARESALEEAAKVADEDAEHDWSDGVPRGGMIATAIRALKGTPPHE